MAGIEIEEENHEVADILVDLIRRETHAFSMRFARSLVDELSAAVELINNPHRFAGFRVLKAPDVPSVLVELGYLSNPKDEAQLRDPDWRGKAADAHISGRCAVCRRKDRRRRLMTATTAGCTRRCARTTVRDLIAPNWTGFSMLPHFAHNGATRVDLNGSGRFRRLAAAAVFAAEIPVSGLERA